MEKKEIKLKIGDKVWWIYYDNNVANVLEGEYIADISGDSVSMGRYLVKSEFGRNLLVDNISKDRGDVLRMAYEDNKSMALSNIRIAKYEFEKMKTDMEVIKTRISKLEKEKMNKWFI